jgi:hypothetical protein
MLIKTTTTVVLLNDQGKEILRTTGKGFTTLSDPAKWTNGLARSIDQSKTRAKVAMSGFLEQLRSSSEASDS